MPRESTLEFVAGSHLGPWLMPRTFMDEEANWFPEGDLAELPDIDADRDAHEILGWELEPGDAVFFHMLTLHAAGGVSDAAAGVLGAFHGRRRRPCAAGLEDLARRSPGSTERAAGGSAMDHPLFPLVWERPA